MKQLAKRLLLCALMTLLLVLTMSCPVSANYQFVPAGWTTPVSGYWTDEQGGRDTYSALRYYRERGDKLEQAYAELYEAGVAHNEQTLAQMKQLIDAQETERKGWQAELRRAKGPGLGLFAGAGVTPSGEVEFVAGIGLVWKIW